jgi:hypothetical protein
MMIMMMLMMIMMARRQERKVGERAVCAMRYAPLYVPNFTFYQTPLSATQGRAMLVMV